MSIDSIPVSTYMSSKGVITETADQNIYAACRMMHKNNIGCVIILGKNGGSHEKPVGIITERDVVRLLGRLDTASIHSPLSKIMSKPVVTISIKQLNQRCYSDNATKEYSPPCNSRQRKDSRYNYR